MDSSTYRMLFELSTIESTIEDLSQEIAGAPNFLKSQTSVTLSILQISLKFRSIFQISFNFSKWKVKQKFDSFYRKQTNNSSSGIQISKLWNVEVGYLEFYSKTSPFCVRESRQG